MELVKNKKDDQKKEPTGAKFGMKAVEYPSKTTINLYYKPDTTSKPSTYILYLMFIVVVLMALAKFMVFDLLADLNTAQKAAEAQQDKLKSYMSVLSEYDVIASEYNRYSSSFLNDNEKYQDRIEVLDMLESTLFANSNVSSFSISENVISVSITNIDLGGTSALVEKIEAYDMVESVSVNTASGGGSYTVRMVITLADTTGGGE